MILTSHSQSFLPDLHPDLVKVILQAAQITPSNLSWIITQGLRTREEELNMWLHCHNPDGTRNDHPWLTSCNGTPKGETSPEGYAGTGESNHQHGQAIDFCMMDSTGKCIWNNLTLYTEMANLFLQAGASLKIPAVYGGTWMPPKTDSDHIELNEAFYPIVEPS